jgi:hypothetical protein
VPGTGCNQQCRERFGNERGNLFRNLLLFHTDIGIQKIHTPRSPYLGVHTGDRNLCNAAFIALIVVNCMILGRQEAFSAKNNVYRSLLDAMGTGIGFTIALVMMGGFREILGTGSFLGFSLFGPSFEPWVIMVLPAGGFLTLGFILLAMGYFEQRKKAKEALTAEATS